MKVDIRDDFKYALQRLLGKAVAAFAVRRWGDPEGAHPSGLASPTTGNRWTIKNHFIAWLAGYVGGELVARFTGRPLWGQKMYDGACDLIVTKAFWSEIVHRLPGGPALLGNVDANGNAIANGNGNQMAILASQAGEGDVLDDGNGNRWLLQGGRWVAMQGLQEATPLDGYGQLEVATPLDGYQQRRFQSEQAMGHLMDPTSPAVAVDAGQYTRRGSPDPFHASFL